jgi:Cu/Zn superoxide dismutase
LSTTVPRAIESSTERTISRSPSSAARLSRKSVDFLVVVAGVDVHQREGELARAEGLFGDAQHADRVLAAGEEQHRVGALAGDFAHDVDGFGFEPVEVGANAQGEARLSTELKGLTVSELIGRSVVVHADPDDYMSQPAGNSGKRVGCGVIAAR